MKKILNDIKAESSVCFMELKDLLTNHNHWSERHDILLKQYLNFIKVLKSCDAENDDITGECLNLISLFYIAIRQLLEKTFHLENESKELYANENFHIRIFDGGLANRIRAICAVQTMLDFSNVKNKIEVFWLPCHDCPCELVDIFELSTLSEKINIITAEKYVYDRDGLHKNFFEVHDLFSEYLFWERYFKDSGQISWGDFLMRYKENLISLFYNNISGEILEKVDTFEKLQFCDKTTGIHIRGTDFKEHYEKIHIDKKLADVDVFVRKLKELGVEQNVFIAADDKSTISDFKKVFCSDSCSYPHVFNENNKRKTDVESALVDLLLLAKCNRIIGTYGSSFSKLSSDLFGAQLITV